MRNDLVYGYFRHCMQDVEANAGGIPTKEQYWLKRLGWEEDGEEENEFFKAFFTIWRLNKENKEKRAKAN